MARILSFWMDRHCCNLALFVCLGCWVVSWSRVERSGVEWCKGLVFSDPWIPAWAHSDFTLYMYDSCSTGLSLQGKRLPHGFKFTVQGTVREMHKRVLSVARCC